eukprot:COSAG02_NODE_2715_length_8175_cov_46.281451_4_plen_32_part_00
MMQLVHDESAWLARRGATSAGRDDGARAITM